MGHHPALSHDRDPIGHRHDLPQLVGDQNDRLPLFSEPAKDAEQVVRLLGGERARGLVQDQDLGPPVEGLQDLHPLLQAHRQVAHAGIRRHLQGIVLRQPRQLPPRPARARGEQRPALGAQDHVLDHRKGVHQHEVLVDHADTGGDGVLAALDGQGPPGDANLTPIGLVEAVEDAHQSGLAGTVLADDPVNGPGCDREAHVPVGVNRAESLVDATKLDRRGAGLLRRIPRFLHGRHQGHFT